MLIKDGNDSSGDYQNILQKDLTNVFNLIIIFNMRKVIATTILNGEPQVYQDGGVYFLHCCDCQLSHLVTIDVEPEKKRAILKFYRDDYMTSKFRKQKNIKITWPSIKK